MRSISRAALIAVVAMLVPAAAAQADTFEVNKLGDPTPGPCTNSHCTLREAVLAANNDSAGADKVVLPNRKRQYELEITGGDEDGGLEGDLDVTNDALLIAHRGRGLATIDANGLDRAIHAFERLTLNRIKVTGGDPRVWSEDDGGAIFAIGGLALKRSRVVGNQGNDGGAIWLGSGNLLLERSIVAGNTSLDDGGGITVRADGADVSVRRSRVSGNDADGNPTAQGGGIDMSANDTTLVISRSTLAGNTTLGNGGAINFDNAGALRIKSSTLSENRTRLDGGALYLTEVSASIVNSTISGNRAGDFGGGVFVGDPADLRLNAVTIARNHGSTDDTGAHAPGGGIFRHTTGTVSVRNTIIALNRLGTEPIRNDCGGEVGEPFDSQGNNLLSTLAPSGICNGFDESGDRVRANPKLGKLKRNGGPTKTVALKKGSPAIGRAHKPSAPNRDQRGRKRDSDPDVGAFERGA
jgi:CSLREA domain-containing protein